MKVILTARVSNLGQIGEVVSVKNGYAKNFLVPNKKAICFTPANQKVFEAKRAEFEKENDSNLKEAQKIKDKLAGKDVIIIESASDDGRLYGSVSSTVIATKVNELVGGKTISRASIFLKKPIKEIGVYFVKLDLHSDVDLELRLIVTRSESEIDALLKAVAKAENAEKSAKKGDAVDAIEVAETAEGAEADASSEEKPAKKTRKKKEAAAE